MSDLEKVNILLVDDQPAKLMTYEVVLEGLGENLIKAASAREALDRLLRFDVAVVLMDVSMPDLDGFQLASMIREHPRYRETAIIFVSAIHLTEADYVRGYEMGAVDYVSAPVVPEILRAKVKVFVDLHRKTKQLEKLNGELEDRVSVRTDELRISNERQTILAREVDHRAKNALAVAQAIVRLSQANTIEEYIAAIEGRISSLARAHALLSDTRWQGASLRTIVEEELAPFRGNDASRFTVSGPDILLKPASAQGIALALHELATNAAKYGAFACPSGKLSLSWDLAGPLRISWQESGVLNTKPPTSLGFGTRVINLSIESQLGGRTHYEWDDDGLNCILEVPDVLGPPVSDRAPASTASGNGNRTILLVEDESLVALMVEDLIESQGFSVAGPYAGLDEAMQALDGANLAGAILDINLAGVSVFPLADILVYRQIPFLFMTGYGSERLESRFPDVAVLQKPVEAQAVQKFLADISLQ
jgi:two-component sensor histidine kinase